MGGTPNWGYPDGWGIMQVDSARGSAITTAEVYNWKENVKGGVAVFKDKVAATNRFFNAVAKHYPNDPDASNPPSSFIAPGISRDLHAKVLYNSATGCPTQYANGVTYQNPWHFIEDNKRYYDDAEFLPEEDNIVRTIDDTFLIDLEIKYSKEISPKTYEFDRRKILDGSVKIPYEEILCKDTQITIKTVSPTPDNSRWTEFFNGAKVAGISDVEPTFASQVSIASYSADLTAKLNMYLSNPEVTEFSFFQTNFNKTEKPELWLSTNRNVNGRVYVWDVFVWTNGKYECLPDYASLREITLSKYGEIDTDLIITYWYGSAIEGTLLGYKITGNKLEEFNLGEVIRKDDEDNDKLSALFANKIKEDKVPRNQLKSYLEDKLGLSLVGLNDDGSISGEKWALEPEKIKQTSVSSPLSVQEHSDEEFFATLQSIKENGYGTTAEEKVQYRKIMKSGSFSTRNQQYTPSVNTSN